MANRLRVMLETGPKGKRVVAVAPEWPGLERGAKTEEAALERLQAYRARYAPIAERAGLREAFEAEETIAIDERYPGTGSTDFWGISFAFSTFDREPVSGEELERELSLMQASWAFFDDVRGRVSAEMQKGPRGGGRDRDKIVAHTLYAELDWAGGLGIRTPFDELMTDEGLRTYRAAYADAIRDYHAQNKPSGKWPLRYLIRHTAFHTLDHAWEMEDKDLTNKPA